MVCDVCNAPVTPPAGTVFTPDAFRQIVLRGFGPSPEAIRHAVAKGATEEQYVHGWRTDLVETSTTPWLLCPSCAARAQPFSVDPERARAEIRAVASGHSSPH